MKERLATLVCALGALALFLTIFLPGSRGGGAGGDVPRPTTEDRERNGYYAALHWLDADHVRALSLRERLEQLAQRQGSGNILIVTLPAAVSFRSAELRSLSRWIQQGNTLLVLAALSDNPDWAFSLGNMASGDLSLLTGLDFAVAGREIPARAKLTEPRQLHLVANRPHAYFEGVREVLALSDYPSRSWTVKLPYDGFVFTLAHEHETGEGVLFTRTSGNGRIIVSTLGTLFTNGAIGLADNARLFANLVSANLGPGAAVLFDDAHQGLGMQYDPARFYRDPRLYLTIAVVVLLWLTWVLGATRLQVPVAGGAVPQEAELVRATGGFLARVLSTQAAARRMFAHFLRRHPLERLERHAGISAADIQQLKRWQADVQAARRVPLLRLHNVMVRIDRRLKS